MSCPRAFVVWAFADGGSPWLWAAPGVGRCVCGVPVSGVGAQSSPPRRCSSA